MLKGVVPKRKNCALFIIDDGYQNALTHAIPVLDEFDIKPLIFVVTGMIDSKIPYWFDRLDVALQAARGLVESVELGQERIRGDPFPDHRVDHVAGELLDLIDRQPAALADQSLDGPVRRRSRSAEDGVDVENLSAANRLVAT